MLSITDVLVRFVDVFFDWSWRVLRFCMKIKRSTVAFSSMSENLYEIYDVFP